MKNRSARAWTGGGKSQMKKMTPKGHFFIEGNIYFFQYNPNNGHFL